MTTILLCRHGESEGNRDRRFGGHGPTPLTPRGRAQARATGRALAAETPGVDVLYSSDLPRAAETAALIGAEVGLAPIETPALRERSIGALEGLTFEEAADRHPEVYAALMRRELDACPPGGESYLDCSRRTTAFLQEVLVTDAGRRVLLVSHALALFCLFRHILGLRDATQPPGVFFQIGNCTLHRFAYLPEDVWKVIAIGERAHLKDIPARSG